MNRFIRLTVALAIAALLLPAMNWVALGKMENPLKNAKVGQWIEFTMKTGAMGQEMEMTMRQTVVAKDAVSVTLKSETTMMGKKMPAQETKIMLDQPYEPYTQGYTDAKVTVLGEGDEAVSVNGKSYSCHWAKVKVVATKPMATEATTKVWTCKEVPVSGMVRMETEADTNMGDQKMKTKMTMELVAFGG